ncbi:hypothetical protein SLS55_009494 [Diplodia seriata]|uniref:Uncharacterized protein n=1 Tax=Diplodia seriata TaxID=420778 RepID=A0ABR3C488_9PEZI
MLNAASRLVETLVNNTANMPNRKLTIVDGQLTVAGQIFDPLPDFEEVFEDFGPINVSPPPSPTTSPSPASPPADDMATSSDDDVGDPQVKVRLALAKKLEKERGLPSGDEKACGAPAMGKKDKKGKGKKGKAKKGKAKAKVVEEEAEEEDLEMEGGGEGDFVPQLK